MTAEIGWRLARPAWGHGFASEDFDHPNLPEGHPLRRHVLYRLAAPVGGSSDK